MRKKVNRPWKWHILPAFSTFPSKKNLALLNILLHFSSLKVQIIFMISKSCCWKMFVTRLWWIFRNLFFFQTFANSDHIWLVVIFSSKLVILYLYKAQPKTRQNFINVVWLKQTNAFFLHFLIHFYFLVTHNEMNMNLNY